MQCSQIINLKELKFLTIPFRPNNIFAKFREWNEMKSMV